MKWREKTHLARWETARFYGRFRGFNLEVSVQSDRCVVTVSTKERGTDAWITLAQKTVQQGQGGHVPDRFLIGKAKALCATLAMRAAKAATP